MGNAGKIKSFVIKHWPLLTLLAVWLVFAHPYFFKGLVPFPSRNLVDFFAPWNGFYGMSVKNNAMSDVITQLYPWKKITIDSWKQLQIPAWNPYQFAGYPLLANVQSAVWTPLNLLFFIFTFNDAWSFLILLQPIAAALKHLLHVLWIYRRLDGVWNACVGSAVITLDTMELDAKTLDYIEFICRVFIVFRTHTNEFVCHWSIFAFFPLSTQTGHESLAWITPGGRHRNATAYPNNTIL